MGALPNGVNQEQFHGLSDTGNRTDLQGAYQYVTLKDIINNFLLMYQGDGQIINNISRDVVIFHAKRGLQELNYDVLKAIRAIEVDINPDTLTWILPEDFVREVRVSWVDEAGYFHPLVQNADTIIAEAYLQDNQYEILFDDQGAILKAAQNSYDPTNLSTNSISGLGYVHPGGYGTSMDDYYNLDGRGRFGVDTGKANQNGWYIINKPAGVMQFSSNISKLEQNPTASGQKLSSIVIEYISDGLESADLGDIRIHKFAEAALYAYMDYNILDSRFGVQEYIVRRKEKNYFRAKKQAKLRLMNLTFDDLYQVLQGQNKRLKI